MTSSYTANLAAYLTADRFGPGFLGIEELADQSFIKYGCVLGGSTMRFFQESNNPIYQKMWAAMESSERTAFVNSNEEGVSRVKYEDGQYAFLMESLEMEYRTSRDCSITQVGELLGVKGYGIAFPKSRKLFNCCIERIIKKI